MNTLHPITEIAERLGRISSQFEPGTPFYIEVVQNMRTEVDRASTRDDLELIVQKLRSKLNAQFTDDQLNELEDAIAEMRRSQNSWPVEAFKEGYRKGTGEELPDDGNAAGRKLDLEQR